LQVSHRFCEPQRGATSTQVQSTLKQVKYEIAQRQLHADPGIFIGIFIGLLVSIFISIFVGIGIEIASLKGSR
jgi:tetrahydromethanopterin S-methyltransferase subunit G